RHEHSVGGPDGVLRDSAAPPGGIRAGWNHDRQQRHVRGPGEPVGDDMIELSERFAEQAAKFPLELRAMLDAELAAGNPVIDLECGGGPDKGKVALVVRYPYRAATPGKPPPGLTYFEITDREPQIFVFRSADERFSLVAAK